MELRHIAQSEGSLLRFLRRELGLSSGLVRRLKFREAFLVNGVPVHTDFPVRPGDEIRVLLDERAPDYPAEPGPLDILYEDEAMIALDKPAGLIMHPTYNRTAGTLANRVLAHYQQTGQACAVHPVSRLDRDTFGVVLLAKNAHVHTLLIGAPKEKIYEALVVGTPFPLAGTVDAPIARQSPTSLLRCVRTDGKPAVTQYETLEPGEISLVRLRPVTGRTHQLRVHMAFIGCPILGDPQYGRAEKFTQQLCARTLRLNHPLTGAAMEFTSKQPLRRE